MLSIVTNMAIPRGVTIPVFTIYAPRTYENFMRGRRHGTQVKCLTILRSSDVGDGSSAYRDDSHSFA